MSKVVGVVLVVERPPCVTCGGTGVVEHGFCIGPGGKPLCDVCCGAKIDYRVVSLEDFARLFTYGPCCHPEGGVENRVWPREAAEIASPKGRTEG